MADTQEFLDDLLNAHAQEFKAGHLDTIKKAILQHFQQEQERAEGRGRTAVLTALKEWADDHEVSYNKFMETELDKVWKLSDKGGKDE